MLRLQAENRRRFGERKGASTELDIVRNILKQFWIQGDLSHIPEKRLIHMML